MKGARALTETEIDLMLNHLSLRNRALFILGIKTGFRIGELLSLNIGDIQSATGEIMDFVKVKKASVKGKIEGRILPINEEAKMVLKEYLLQFPGKLDEPLFRSVLPSGRVIGRLDTSGFHKALKTAAKLSGILDWHLISTHSMRKSFAKKMYLALGKDIYKLQKALGHRSLSSTASYLSVDQEEIFNAIRNSRANEFLNESKSG